jgi:outer membrane protein OmpA-like peptidoglycan-associated protein
MYQLPSRWRRSVPKPAAHLEEAAQRRAAEALAQPRPAGEGTTVPALEQDQFETLPGGQPLAGDDRAFFESRFGRDFSAVRVHADEGAAEAADDVGARAFALGRDIVFGPGQFAPDTADGRQLLAHELSHTVQQSEAGQPAMQMQPKKPADKQSVGSAPPSEPFVTMTQAGSEDGFVLFPQDSAELGSDGETALLKLVGTNAAAVTVHIHGYASQEGDPVYNLNLSAHRGATVKRFLDSRLPAESQVVIYAHGETKEFGSEAKNRRVGVDVTPGVISFGFKPKIGSGLEYRLKPDRPAAGDAPTVGQGGLFGPKPSISTDPNLSLPPAALQPVPPTQTRRDLMDIPGALAPFASHGVSPGAAGNVIDNWDRIFRKYKALGFSDDRAATLANMELSSTEQSYLRRDQPNALDRSNDDWKAAHPNDTSIGPIMSPNLLELFSKKKKK